MSTSQYQLATSHSSPLEETAEEAEETAAAFTIPEAVTPLHVHLLVLLTLPYYSTLAARPTIEQPNSDGYQRNLARDKWV